MFKKNAVAAIIFSLGFFINQTASAETLRNVINHTVCTNPDIRVQANIRQASNEGVRQARAGYFPSVTLSAGYGRESSRNNNTFFKEITLWRTDRSVLARQMLFDGFETPSEVARNKAKTNADAFKVWGTTEDVALSTVQAYLDVLRNRELLRVAQNNLSVHESTYTMVSHLSEQGIGREADTQQTRGRVDLARANLISARNNLQDSIITFEKVTGIYPVDLAPAPNVHPSVLPRTEAEALHLAIINHPILKSAFADIAEARGEHEASKAKLYPRLDLVLEASRNKNIAGVEGPNDTDFAGLQMEYNIFQGGKDMARIRETAYHVQEAMEIRNRTFRQVKESMRLSWTAYINSRARIPSLVAHEYASTLTTGAYKKQFELNKRTILDVLDSQNELFTSQQDLINERYSLLLAKYRILNSMGHLVEYLNIPLPPEAYVPYRKDELITGDIFMCRPCAMLFKQ